MTNPKKVTVLGAGGWIGSSLVTHLKQHGRNVIGIERKALPDWLSNGDDSGTIIFAIGLTADFRNRPHDTIHAHSCLLSETLRKKQPENFLYISSSRVYSRSQITTETAQLPCLSQDPSDLYNLSKLLGESLVLQDPRNSYKVVRLSNVVGKGQPPSTFIGSLIKSMQANKQVTIRQAADTEKDYVDLEDVVRLLPEIAEHGRERLYNFGSGHNTCHADVARWLEKQGAAVSFAMPPDPGLSFPPLCISRLLAEFPAPKQPIATTQT